MEQRKKSTNKGSSLKISHNRIIILLVLELEESLSSELDESSVAELELEESLSY